MLLKVTTLELGVVLSISVQSQRIFAGAMQHALVRHVSLRYFNHSSIFFLSGTDPECISWLSITTAGVLITPCLSMTSGLDS